MRILVIFAAFAFACGPSSRGDDGLGGADAGNNGGTVDANVTGNPDTCSDAAKLVYVVDANNAFSKFDPSTKTFTTIGNLSCPAGFLATPHSMGVDRDAVAWVLYSSGQLFRVDTTTLACTKSNWAAQQGLQVFGMGFSTDAQGGTADTLFVAGGSDQLDTTTKLATVSTSSFSAVPVGNVTGWPELTGNANAELWGWFPSDSTGTTTPRIEQINKQTATAMTTYMLPTLKGAPMAWAFAFWGGDYWIFLQKANESSTSVYQIDGRNGSIKTTTPAPGRRIVGAGVSTCAPVVIL